MHPKRKHELESLQYTIIYVMPILGAYKKIYILSDSRESISDQQKKNKFPQ